MNEVVAGRGPITTAPLEDELEIIEREALSAGSLDGWRARQLVVPHANCGDWTDRCGKTTPSDVSARWRSPKRWSSRCAPLGLGAK